MKKEYDAHAEAEEYIRLKKEYKEANMRCGELYKKIYQINSRLHVWLMKHKEPLKLEDGRVAGYDFNGEVYFYKPFKTEGEAK